VAATAGSPSVYQRWPCSSACSALRGNLCNSCWPDLFNLQSSHLN
jgi:hypothetical protein